MTSTPRPARPFGTLPLATAALLACAAVSPAGEDADAPYLPTPPRQHEPWTPPADTVPPDAASAAATLFAQGLADPRGCVYREVEVVVGSLHGGDFTKTTRGWLLPVEAPRGGERTGRSGPFAVCWNGLVYPVVRVGPPADLAADVADTVRRDREARARYAAADPIRPYSSRGFRADDGLDPALPRGIPICLLLRLGRDDLAGRLHEIVRSYAFDRYATPDGRGEWPGPYLTWAGDWLWARFSRSIRALMRGDDRLALADARELARVHPLVERTAERMGYERGEYFASNRRDEVKPYVDFLGQVPHLHRDLERRAREPGQNPPRWLAELRRGGVSREALRAGLADRSVDELVAALDEARAQQMSQPGGLMWGGSALFAAIRAKGEEAIPALLDAWEHDDRLTRSVGYGRDFARSRSIAEVRDVAWYLVSTILKVRHYKVEEARAYWEENRAKPPHERWYDTLADDTAGRDQWMQAASRIVQPTDVETTGAWTSIPARPPGYEPVLRGEPLRDRENPSVLDLMARRAADISDTDDTGHAQRRAHDAACGMALIAAKWDPRAAVPLLADQQRRTTAFAEERRGAEGYHGAVDDEIGPALADLTAARVRAGDGDAAFRDYWLFVSEVDHTTIHRQLPDLLEPVWRFPDEPGGRKTAEALFRSDDSPWTPLLQASGGNAAVRDLVDSPLLGVPAFRTHLLEQLADESPAATVEFLGLEKETSNRFSSRDTHPSDPPAWLRPSLWVEAEDPRAPAAGTAFDLRVYDVYAAALASAPGMPRFGWYWPRADRDAARAEQVALLRRYGPRYRYEPPADGGAFRSMFRDGARVTFPLLGRPAEPADVERGRAIFTLAAEPGERRVVSDLDLPRGARRTDVEADTVVRRHYRAAGGGGGSGVFNPARVTVWQAEEVRDGEDWVRHYGVVGPNGFVRLPADRLELDPVYRK